MELFSLPHTTKLNRVIPKNAFDSYTTAKQKKLFTDLIARITWTHKIATDTVNLEAKDITEIQVFRIELKAKEDIQPVLDIIDKAIPYHIIFVVQHEHLIYLSTSPKHPNPHFEDNAVIDWTFKTDWFAPADKKYNLALKKSIDATYQDLCIQLSGQPSLSSTTVQELIEFNKQVGALEKEIASLKSAIAKSKQFKDKVNLNLKLQQVELTLKKN